MSIAKQLTDSLTIQRPTRVETDYGYREDFADLATVRGRIVQGGSGTSGVPVEATAGRDTITVVAACYLPAGTDVTPLDRIRDNADDTVWQVASPPTRITKGRRVLALQVALRYTEDL